MFISMMFAGHHTTSGTAAWTLIELLRHPRELAEVAAELDALYARRAGGELPGPARDPAARSRDQGGAPAASAADPAAARRHQGPGGRGLPRSPPAPWSAPAQRSRTAFLKTSLTQTTSSPSAMRNNGQEDLVNRWTWIPFGAGRHRCVGANFAMIQLKAIFSVLLRDWDLRAGPAFRQLPQRPLQDGRPAGTALRCPIPQEKAAPDAMIEVDLDLCQGHAIASSRRPRSSQRPEEGPGPDPDPEPPESERAGRQGRGQVLPHPGAAESGNGESPE